MQQQREWLTVEAAAGVLKVGVPTVESMIERGIIDAEQRDGTTMVSYAALLAFLKEDQRKLLDDEGQPPDLIAPPEA